VASSAVEGLPHTEYEHDTRWTGVEK